MLTPQKRFKHLQGWPRASRVGVVEITFFFGGHEHSWMANASFKCGDIPLPSTSRFVYLRVLPGPAEVLEFLHQTGSHHGTSARIRNLYGKMSSQEPSKEIPKHTKIRNNVCKLI